MESIKDPVLKVTELRTIFPLAPSIKQRLQGTRRAVHAVDGVSFSISEGETLGLVGESGCGKSTLGRSLLRLIQPTSGEVSIGGTLIADASPSSLRKLRQNAQIIFQDPSASLDPRLTIGQTLEEPLIIFKVGDQVSRRMRVRELLDLVGLTADAIHRYPHQLSGGQRQRVGIAAALALRPKLIVADEPTSALDVSVQAQILNLLMDIQKESGLAYLFISHNLDVVRYLSDRVAVMYLGMIVELGATEQILSEPLHPYTKALLDSAPGANPSLRKNFLLEGEPPSPIDPPKACRFHPRCPIAREICSRIDPVVTIEDGHSVACHAVTWARSQRFEDGNLPELERWQPNI